MIIGMYEIFKQLHQQKNPFILGNVWNASSARIFEQHGYKAIGTSSAAIANSLGYEDGEKISFNELFFIVEKIIAAVKIPLSVDIERDIVIIQMKYFIISKNFIMQVLSV